MLRKSSPIGHTNAMLNISDEIRKFVRGVQMGLFPLAIVMIALQMLSDRAPLRRVFLPNEDAAFASALDHSFATIGTSISVIWAVWLCVYFLPVALSARIIQRWLAAWLCRTQPARDAQLRYFATVDASGLGLTTVVFALTFALTYINAKSMLSPELAARGMSAVDLTFALMFVAFFGGLYFTIICYLVDLIFLASGINPLQTYWDEVIALAIAGPMLCLVFQNSWLTLISNVVAGLGVGLLLKWQLRRQCHTGLETA